MTSVQSAGPRKTNQAAESFSFIQKVPRTKSKFKQTRFNIDIFQIQGINGAVSSFDDCEPPMIRHHADILDMKNELSSAALRGKTMTAAATAPKHTSKTTKTTA